MQALKIKGSGYVPTVILDKENNQFEISGRSLPEDVASFYAPILEWFTEYAKEPNEKTVFDFKLSYYNTASSKLLLNVMLKLEALAEEDNEVLVRWHFPEDDEDLEEAGEEYSDLVDIEFEQVPY